MVFEDKASSIPLWRWVWKTLGSVQLAVILIVLLAVVLAWATIVESTYGREYAQWFVYGSQWFVSLLGLLGLNILVATIARFPWKRRLAFLVTHAGLLILLFGSIQTFLGGIDGRLSVVEGESADALVVPTQTRFTAAWPERGNGVASFILPLGPVDWPEGKTVDLGELNGVRLRVLKYMRNTRVENEWIPDDSPGSTPVLRFALVGPDGTPVREDLLAAEQFGGILSMGPATFQFQRLATESMLDDFLNPPVEDLGSMGILSIHHDGQRKRVKVEENLGKRIALDGTDLSVEIKEYLPNAVPAGNATFTSEGDHARNPMLELLVYEADSDEPIRQIAFAKHPLLNFDGIHGRGSPVKFWYHHPISAEETATEFVQAPDGTLYCRTVLDGAFRSHGKVDVGQMIPAAAGFQVSVLEHMPSARQHATFHSVGAGTGEAKGAEAAVLMEVEAGGTTERLWLRRQDPTYGYRTYSTPQGLLALGFGYNRFPLGFSVELLDFERSKNPGSMGDASFKSTVRLVDPHQDIDEKTEISMNSPLTHGRFTIYQSGFDELPSGKEASIFTVAYDPGRFLKYLGSVMICLGSAAMFYLRRRRNNRGAVSRDLELPSPEALETVDRLEPQGDKDASAFMQRESQVA